MSFVFQIQKSHFGMIFAYILWRKNPKNLIEMLIFMFIAHVGHSNQEHQSVAAHLTETAAIAKLLAAKLGLDLVD